MRFELPALFGRGRDLADPFASFRREMDDLMKDFGKRLPSNWTGPAAFTAPAVDIAETKDALEVSAELPGIDEKDLSVTLDGQTLVIAGEKKAEQEQSEKDWHVVERSYGSFRRVVPLPFEAEPDKVTASFKDGVLKLTVPKPAERVEARKAIPINKA